MEAEENLQVSQKVGCNGHGYGQEGKSFLAGLPPLKG